MSSPASTPISSLCIGKRYELGEGYRTSWAGLSKIRRKEWILEDEGLFTPRWLELAPLYPRLFWRSRSGAAQTLAMGEIVEGSLAFLMDLISDADPSLRIFGGRRFAAPHATQGVWSNFPNEYFFIPKAEIIHSGGRTKLVVNISENDSEMDSAAQWIEALRDMGTMPRPGVLTRWDQPNYVQWAEVVDNALAEFRRGVLQKTVLSRKSCLELTETVSPFALIEILMGGAPACFHFCIQPSERSGAFLGTSPELLYRRSGDRLESEAVAGTRPRSLDTVEDERLESQLLKISKEQLEHRLVVDSLQKTFQRLCTEFEQDKSPSVLKLSRVQHLRTAFSGHLRDNLGDAQILEAFHPTPATCGSPAREALEFILGHEPFDRGWYAGPIGCVSQGDAEFTVAIRSMLWRGSELNVFAGAGIVEGSDPEREWSELEDKIAGVLHLLES